MAHKDYRINTKINSGEKVLKVSLKQGIDTFKILSLDLTTEDAYQIHTSEYGVIVGRVLANDAFGVPNVKVSVFVEADNNDSDILSQVYPFKTANSTDGNNIKYNLLQDKPYTGIDGLHTTTGTFPNKRMVLDNDSEIEAFDKYWSYTTITNESGDYMIFGVPTGNCQVHFDCDLSDVGLISQRPYDLINKGYSPNLFKSPTEFKDETINSATHIISQNATVFVYPFWGDKQSNEIGITRNDLNLDYKFEPTCIFMGSSITDSTGGYIGLDGVPNGSNGKFKNLQTSSGNIEIIRQTEDGLIESLDDNVVGIINGNGVWCYSIPMNLDRIGTNEEGKIIPIKIPGKGIPTRARVRFRISLTGVDDPNTSQYCGKMLVPCNPPLNTLTIPSIDTSQISLSAITGTSGSYYEFGSKTPDIAFRDLYWGKVYSVKQYYPRFEYIYKNKELTRSNTKLSGVDYSNYPIGNSIPFSCISSIDSVAGLNSFPYTTMYAGAENMQDLETKNWFTYHLSEFASNNSLTEKGLHFCFENDWINGCLYFPRVEIVRMPDGTYDYFGKKSDDGKSYENIYYTGRHNYYLNGNNITVYDSNPNMWNSNANDLTYLDIDNSRTSLFSQIPLYNGLITKRSNNLGQNIFYYSCGGYNSLDWCWERLYATDIICLGNLTDIYDSLPQLYTQLPATTTIFPPICVPRTAKEAGMNMNGYSAQLNAMYGKDTDIVDMFGNYTVFRNEAQRVQGEECAEQNNDNWSAYEDSEQPALAALLSSAWSSVERDDDVSTKKFRLISIMMERTSVFFGYKVRGCQDFLHYMTPTFVNTSRICELDVQNDHAIQSGMWWGYSNTYIPINGIIDNYDIITNTNRSAFASMNYDITKSVVDHTVGHQRFLPTPMSLFGFDGRLQDHVAAKKFGSGYVDEAKDDMYIKFRYGQLEPRRYSTLTVSYLSDLTEFLKALVSIFSVALTGFSNRVSRSSLPLFENSFYFYFGLRSGYSALDLFNEKYGTVYKDDMSYDNMINIRVNDYSTCSDGSMVVNVYVDFDKSLSRPLTYYVYKRGDLITKGQNWYNTLYLGQMQSGQYTLEIVDKNNISLKKSFTVFIPPVSLNYKVEHTTNYDVLIITTLGTTTKSTGILFTKHSNDTISYGNYYLKFNKNIQSTGDVISNIEFVKETSNDNNLIVEVFNNDCFVNNVYINLSSKSSDGLVFNDIPIDVLSPWSSGSSENQWNSLNTAYANHSQNYNFNSEYSQNEQLGYISQMMGVVYGGSGMFISSPSNYINSTFCPRVDVLFNSGNNVEELWSGGASLEDVPLMMHYVNGSVDTSYDLPHLIGENYPIKTHSRSGLKIHSLALYQDNYTYKLGDGAKINKNYFGFKSQDANGTDRPKSLKWEDELNDMVKGYWDSSYTKNMFAIQTVDKRLDYEIAIKTPLLLPSGYNRFSALQESKALINGSTKIELFGGLRFDHDENFKITCYGYDADKKCITGSPTNNATLYSEKIYEGNANNSILDKAVKSRNVWQQRKNDHITYDIENGLMNNSHLSLDMTDCSTDITNGTVKVGKSLNLSISYIPPIQLIHGSISDDTFDVVYVQPDAGMTSYVAMLKDGDDVSSLAFTISTDPLYNGRTYTDIRVGDVIPDYPEWANKYLNDYAINNGLNLLHCTDMQSKAVNKYPFKVESTYAASAYDGLKIDTEASNYPQYSNGDNNMVSMDDTNLSSVYTFNLDTDTIPSGVTFGTYDYLMIPIKKVYCGNTLTLLNQGMVYNSGYAYYVGKLNISQNDKVFSIQLSSPLMNNGCIPYSTIQQLRSGNNIHTVGNIANYYCNDAAQVKYDADSLKFTIRLKDSTSKGIVPFYFQMENGLKYKVKLNYV